MFYGKTVVIKYGGSAMIDPGLKEAVTKDIVLLKYIGINTVVVHGGGPEVSHMMDRLGKKPRFINGLRVTDQETMEIVEMVLAGRINKEIVALINKSGGKGVGLSGRDGNLIVARQRNSELGFVGDIKAVNPDILHVLSREGFIPIIAPIASDEEGRPYNINADHVAGHIAAALKADKLILLTDVEGVFADPDDKTTLLSLISAEDIRDIIHDGSVSGGMIPKLEACVSALEGGVSRAHIIDGRVVHSLLLEIFTNEGIGTMVVKGQL
ncbi:MAG TPA: acetylglutamate kinase [Firmicutes bacterium]|nr:acetylglutamate kinase [Bacillota bacterium]